MQISNYSYQTQIPQNKTSPSTPSAAEFLNTAATEVYFKLLAYG
jgi:hypothetical protein